MAKYTTNFNSAFMKSLSVIRYSILRSKSAIAAVTLS